MKHIGLVALVALAGCIGEDDEAQQRTLGAAVCDPAAFSFLIGKPVAALDGVLTPEAMRIVEPDSMVTMDHNPERLNVHLDDKGIIREVRCG
jgi:hypothetical protein